MRLLIRLTIFIGLWAALYYSIKGSVEPEAWANFWDFMLGPYRELYDKYIAGHETAILTHPIVLVLIGFAVFNGYIASRRK